MATFTIYHGAEKPMRAVGEHQCNLLAFAETKLRFPVSMTRDRGYIVKVGWNLQQGEVWLPMDGRQIEKHIRDILKREA